MHVYTLPTGAHQPHPFERRWRDVFPLRPIDQLPTAVNLGDRLGPLRNQNIPALGECSAESGAGALDWLCRNAGDVTFVGSSLFLYECERALVGQLTQDAGARLRQTQYALQTVGTCANASDPDVKQDFLIQLTPALLHEAAQHRIADGLWCPTLDEILNALAHPTRPTVVQAGIAVYPGFEDPATLASGIVPLPKAGEAPLGGHAVLAFGFDRIRRLVWLRNSWGACYKAAVAGPGHGNFALPFDYFAHPSTFLSARAYYRDPV